MNERLVVSGLGNRIAVDGGLGLPAATREALEVTWCGTVEPVSLEVSASVDGRAPSPEELRERLALTSVDVSRGKQYVIRAEARRSSDGGGVMIVDVSQETTTDATDASDLSRSHLVGLDPHGGLVALPSRAHPARSAASRPVRLTKVVLLDVNASHLRTDIEELSLERALLLLEPQFLHFHETPAPLRTICSFLQASGGAVLVRSPDLAEAERTIERLSSGSAMATDPEIAEWPTTRPSPGLGVYRGPALDRVVTETGTMLVLTGPIGDSSIRVLQRVEAVLWQSAAGRSRAMLLDHAGRLLTDSAEADLAAHLSDACDALLEEGLLAEEPSWRISDDAAWVDGPARSVVLPRHDRAPQPIVLEGAAYAVWCSLAERRTLRQSELIATIAQQYAEEAAAISDDVTTLLAELADLGAVGWV